MIPLGFLSDCSRFSICLLGVCSMIALGFLYDSPLFFYRIPLGFLSDCSRFSKGLLGVCSRIALSFLYDPHGFSI